MPDPETDSTSTPKRNPPVLQPFINHHELYDGWRCLKCKWKTIVFFSTAHNSYSRIDLFLLDHGLLTKATSFSINNITWSDHASLSLTLKDSLFSNATYIWRSNSRILQLLESKNEIVQCLNNYFEDNAPSVKTLSYFGTLTKPSSEESLSSWELEWRGSNLSV